MADHVLQLTGEQLDETLRKVSQLSEEKVGNFRHLTTITNNTGSDVLQIDITEDKDGNPFSCSEFFVYATFPVSVSNQLYIGAGMWNWLFFYPSARSSTATKTLALKLEHKGGGWWQGSGNSAENVSSPITAVNGSNLYTNFRSNVNVGEKINTLTVYGGNSPLPDGTVIEVYGR